MALAIASQLRKELSGWTLFDNVSFKVERRDRVALSGANGAGKTTLLRILNGETDYQGGDLMFSKGTRVALHDQRPSLEQELQSLDAGIVLVAHDRWFLEAVTNAVLELGGGKSIYFSGPWHQWRIEKAARASAAGKTADRLSVDIARLERFVERFRYKKSKAKQAQAKLTQIGRLEHERKQAAGELESLTVRRKRLGFDFLDPPRSGRTVVETRGLEIAAGDKPLLRDVEFALERGEHVALVGPNGSGKTTLLETLLGLREPVDGAVRL